MKITTRGFYTIHVQRDRMIRYNAEDYPSLADARVAAKRLGEFVEIRRVRVIQESEPVETVEV